MYFVSVLGIQIDHKKANVFLESEGRLVMGGWCDAPSLNSFQFVELQGGVSLLAATKNLQLRNLNNDNPLGRKNVLLAWLQDLRR